jgi:hypothetical protein
MQIDGYTYSQEDPEQLRKLWQSHVRPSGWVGQLVPTGSESGKRVESWMPLDRAINNGDSFLAELPHHLIGIDLDHPHSTDGTGAELLSHLNSKGIIYIHSTSGSPGWTIIINLWSTLSSTESKADYLLEPFDKKIDELKVFCKRAFPRIDDWDSRFRRSIRPPLSPYLRVGELTLLSPKSLQVAIKCANYGGVINDSIRPNRPSFEQIIQLQSSKEDRHANYMALAMSMIQAGYHFKDFELILTKSFTPIGKQYQDRSKEPKYNKTHLAIKKDLTTTWTNAFKRVQEKPAVGDVRRMLPCWTAHALKVIANSDYDPRIKTTLIATSVAIASIAFKVGIMPTIAESRLSAVAGVTDKTISVNKKRLQELGLVTVSFKDSPIQNRHFGSLFTLLLNDVVITDINTPITRGNRDITSVIGVNDFHITNQITHLITSWQPNSLWLTEAAGRVNGHVLWALLNSFPDLKIEEICEVLGWSNRTTRETLAKLQIISVLHKESASGQWITYGDIDHWNCIIRRTSLQRSNIC